ncbi:MAG: hypothetical protein Q9M30_11005 [Mariprofundaceae bacterium]|nr:hypothetical protein [Mariprofundaceae bacterium]
MPRFIALTVFFAMPVFTPAFAFFTVFAPLIILVFVLMFVLFPVFAVMVRISHGRRDICRGGKQQGKGCVRAVLAVMILTAGNQPLPGRF